MIWVTILLAFVLGLLLALLFGALFGERERIPGFVVVCLLLGAIAERSPRHYREVQAEIEAKQETERYLGIAFWVLLAALVVAIVVAYLVA